MILSAATPWPGQWKKAASIAGYRILPPFLGVASIVGVAYLAEPAHFPPAFFIA
jgi:hypothetical protein